MDPTFLDLLLTGQYLPAIGVALIALVAFARAGLGKLWPWFKTQTGGYVIGFGSAALLYIGAAFSDGRGLTPAVLSAALGAGWAASGGFEMLGDAIAAWRKKPPAPPLVAMVVLVTVLLGCSSCKELPTSVPGSAVIDCTLANQDSIESLLTEFKSLLVGQAPSWSTIKDKAMGAGATIGGCALALVVQHYLGGRKANPVDETWKANDTLNDFRTAVAGGATFHTHIGDL